MAPLLLTDAATATAQEPATGNDARPQGGEAVDVEEKRDPERVGGRERLPSSGGTGKL